VWYKPRARARVQQTLQAKTPTHGYKGRYTHDPYRQPVNTGRLYGLCVPTLSPQPNGKLVNYIQRLQSA